MSNRKNVWFEDAGRKLDPGLVEQLRINRRHDPDDTSNTEIPVIVYFKKDCRQASKDDLIQTCNIDTHNKLDKELRTINGIRGHLTPGMIKQIKDHEAVDRVYHDRVVTAFLDIASEHTGATAIHEDHNLTGSGMTIAVIDTGIHPHQDLAERITGFYDLVNGQSEPYDDNGHGTHCAGDAAGNGELSDGQYAGPAPEASIVGVKALDEEGGGRLSNIIEGIEWCVDHRAEYDINIISLSLGSAASESFRDDPLALAAREAWHQGIVVCAAAGNDGPQPSTIGTPAIDPFIITVGATTDQDTVDRNDDVIAEYSSRGPTVDSLEKPDVYAPGTNIIAPLAPDSALESQLSEQVIDENYVQLSGTSMATPICAGIIALILEANGDLSPNDIKAILKVTSEPTLDDVWGYIHGIDALERAQNYGVPVSSDTGQ